MARNAGIKNIPVIAVGMGTAKGVKIYLDNGSVVLNSDGEPVVTKINTELLESIAELSNGKAYLYNEIPKIKDELFYILRNLEPGGSDKNLKLVDNDIHNVFLTLSILFFIITILIRGWRWKNII